MEVSRIRVVLIKVLKLFRVVLGPGHSSKDVLASVKHDHIVFGIILFAAEDQDGLAVLSETGGVAEPSLEDLLLVLVLEEDRPLFGGQAELSDNAQSVGVL